MKYFFKAKNPDLRGTSVEMWGITDPFISRGTACSPAHSASCTYLPLPLRPGRFVEVTMGSWVCSKCCREKVQEGTSFVLARVYAPFWALQGNNFYIFYHSWMYYLYLQVVKSIFTVNDKGMYCFIQFLPCCKSSCKVAGKGRIREIILEFSLLERNMCLYVYLEWVGAYESLSFIYVYRCMHTHTHKNH